MQLRERWQHLRRSEKLSAVAALVYVLYALAGYFIVSPMARDSVQQALAQATGRDVSLGELVFNPLALSVTVTDFAFLDADGEPFVGFDRFYADFELSSLVRWSWHFDAVELDQPRIRVTQTGQRQFNFDDLLALGKTDTASDTDDDGPAVPVAFSIDEFQLTNGDFRFVDRSRNTPQELVLDQLSFEILDFSTRSDDDEGNVYELAITSPAGGRFEWSGQLRLNPLQLQGRLALAGLELTPFAEFYADRLRFRVPSGELKLASEYRVDASGDVPVIVLSNGELSLESLAVRASGADTDTLTLPAVNLTGINLDTASQQAGAERLSLEGLQVTAIRTDTGLDLATLFLPLPASEPETSAEVPSETSQAADDGDAPEPATGEAASETAPAWSFALQQLALTEGGVTVQDNTLAEPGTLTLAPLSLTLDNLHWGEDGDYNLAFETALNEAGNLSLQGSGTLAPLTAALTVDASGLSLLAVEPWVREAARVDLQGGNLSVDGQLEVSQAQEAMAVRASGDLSVTDFDLLESDGSALTAFQRLDVNGFTVDMAGRDIQVREVVLTGLAADSHVDAQGRTVAQRISVPVAAPVPVPAAPVESWRYRVNRVRVENGEVLFADRSLQPDFTIGLYQLNGTLEDIDTGSDQPSALSLETLVDKYAPLRVRGDLHLLGNPPGADLTVSLQDYEMTSLTPYTGIYVGHTVKQGQLTFDSRVSLDNTLLDSTTDLRASNFFLGDKVDSDESIKAPVKLGLAVLRNKQGLIRLPIKASGDLSDPNVSVSGIILKALGNVLVKAATSPFSVLAGLAGGESLENLVFEPGGADLTPNLSQELATLAQLLEDRPALDLQLAGSWAQADREALARADLVEETWRGDWPGLDAALADAGFRRRVANRYETVTGNDAEQLAEVSGDDDAAQLARAQAITRNAWQALLERDDAVAPARLEQLANARVVNIKTALIDNHGVDGARLFLRNSAMPDREPVAGVQLGLALD